MKAAIALLTDYRIQNFVRKIVFDLNRKYNIDFLASLLPAHISLKQPFYFESMEKLEIGIDIGGYITEKAEGKLLKRDGNYSIVRLIISEGKNRQVRRMFKSVGHEVIELERIAIGKITAGSLKEGNYRLMTREEVKYLQRL